MKNDINYNNIESGEGEENIEEGENYEQQQDEVIEYEKGNEQYEDNYEQENDRDGEEEYYQDEGEEYAGEEQGEDEVEQDEKGTQVEQNEQEGQVDQGTQMSQAFQMEQDKNIQKVEKNKVKKSQTSYLKTIPQITTSTISNVQRRQSYYNQNYKIPPSNNFEKIEKIKYIQNEFPSARNRSNTSYQIHSSYRDKTNSSRDNQRIYEYQKISYTNKNIEQPNYKRRSQITPIQNIYSTQQKRHPIPQIQNYSFTTSNENRPYPFRNKDYKLSQKSYEKFERRNIYTPQNHIQTFNINGLIYYSRCPNCNFVLNVIPNDFQTRNAFQNNFINISDEYNNYNYVPNNTQYNNYHKVSHITQSNNSNSRYVKTEPSQNQIDREEKLLKERKERDERIIKEKKEREEKKLRDKKEKEEKKIKERKELEERLKKQREEREKKFKEEREKKEKLKKEKKEQQQRDLQKLIEQKEKERNNRISKEKNIQNQRNQRTQNYHIEQKKEYKSVTQNTQKTEKIDYNSYRYNRNNFNNPNRNNNIPVPKNYYINEKGVVVITPPNTVTTTVVKVTRKPDYSIYNQDNYGRPKNMGFYQSQKYESKVYVNPIRK